jgi:hypothetical protein
MAPGELRPKRFGPHPSEVRNLVWIADYHYPANVPRTGECQMTSFSQLEIYAGVWWAFAPAFVVNKLSTHCEVEDQRL